MPNSKSNELSVVPRIEPGLSKSEQTRRTRALIIETGIRCLAAYGFTQTNMHLISKEAGISRGPMNYHFADKNDLMGAIAEALPLGAGQDVLARLRAVTGVDARLAAIIDLAIEQHRGMHHFAAIELLVAARQDPALAHAIGPHFDVAENQLDQWFCDYMAELNWARDTLISFRTVMVAALRGLALDHVLQADSDAHKAALSMFRRIFLSHITQAENQND
ncbi:MAG: TetR/AcrR family transcriptional regulator [Hyphomonadaceae bacterium]|jgi:AcrR family transcriptional regulator